jgi:3',5'-cyclic AMP phosphodiesterase CpdA
VAVIRLLHFSDPHFEAPLQGVPPSEWLNKRAAALVAHRLLRRRRFREAVPKTEALAAWARAQDVDAIVCTGDFTAFGTEPELAEARRRLEPFVRAGVPLVVVPGNHDIYLAASVRDARFERHFGDLLATDRPDLCADGAWPLVRLVGDHVAVVAINSARPNPPWWRSSGRIPPRQLDALSHALDVLHGEGRFIVVATHHAPRRASGRPDSFRHGLVNGAALERLLRAHLRRGMLVHGHVHRCYHLARHIAGSPIFGAGSATHAGRESFWLYDVGEDGAQARKGRWTGSGFALDATLVRA